MDILSLTLAALVMTANGSLDGLVWNSWNEGAASIDVVKVITENLDKIKTFSSESNAALEEQERYDLTSRS